MSLHNSLYTAMIISCIIYTLVDPEDCCMIDQEDDDDDEGAGDDA